MPYPFAAAPEAFLVENCALQFEDGKHFPLLIWCYTTRRLHRNTHFVDERSLSQTRITDVPAAIGRLSAWHAIINARPRTISSAFYAFSMFMSWADRLEHGQRYEGVLGDEEIALESLEAYHSYLRNQVMVGEIALSSAADREQRVINMMSEIHGKDFVDLIEPLGRGGASGTVAPAEKDVALFVSYAEGVFDATAAFLRRYADGKNQIIGPVSIEASTMNGSVTLHLRSHYCIARLADLACHSFAAIFMADSGANLQVAIDYVLPENHENQLETPDRVGLKQKVVKFRANGKEVPVYLTAITLSRLAEYLAIRKRLIDMLRGLKPPNFLIRGRYEEGAFRPTTSAAPISQNFLVSLRRNLQRVGVTLPDVTFKQLRVHKNGYFARRNGVVVAAHAMGHTIETAIRSYCKANAESARAEMSTFFDSLGKRVVELTVERPNGVPHTGVMAGSCQKFGDPRPMDAPVVVEPDCRKAEGCFFCENFCLHADEMDLRKLLSCRYVLQKLIPFSGVSVTADRVYSAVLHKIDRYLEEMKDSMSGIYDRVSSDVLEEGNLTVYWQGKLQQLYLLQIIA
ncbi:hypothetical protein [Pseudorhodoferax soli]|uniref:hypothetical protein n=1 Tax=Pseudorhodoferax soli TaxID=545864 RepID=UPI0011C07115|nr:hypothetical protein [Pseudorhodoferax soli]